MPRAIQPRSSSSTASSSSIGARRCRSGRWPTRPTPTRSPPSRGPGARERYPRPSLRSIASCAPPCWRVRPTRIPSPPALRSLPRWRNPSPRGGVSSMTSSPATSISGPRANMPRREAPRLIPGHGRYVADVARPGLLPVAGHRGLHAHARVVKIDAEAARRCPGVAHVLVPADVAALGRLPLLVPHPSLLAPVCSEILPQEIVSYVGQPVALVVAESAAQAADAPAALPVEHGALPAVAP